MKNKFIKKMASIIEEKPQSPKTDAKQNEEVPLSPRRKQALVTYMALLLALAFSIVTVSLVIQQQNSEGTIDTLSQNANQALARAEQLQKENETLRENNQALQTQVETLTEQLEMQQQSLNNVASALDDLQASYADLEIALQQSQDSQQAAAQVQAGVTTAYNALIRAINAQQMGNEDQFKDCLAILADYHQYLSQDALNLYQGLLVNGN